MPAKCNNFLLVVKEKIILTHLKNLFGFSRYKIL